MVVAAAEDDDDEEEEAAPGFMYSTVLGGAAAAAAVAINRFDLPYPNPFSASSSSSEDVSWFRFNACRSSSCVTLLSTFFRFLTPKATAIASASASLIRANSSASAFFCVSPFLALAYHCKSLPDISSYNELLFVEPISSTTRKTFLPSADGCHDRMTEIVLAILVFLYIFPAKLIFTATYT